MDVKKKIVITGQRVHDAGYRHFLPGMEEDIIDIKATLARMHAA